jgi:hypothetical protein
VGALVKESISLWTQLSVSSRRNFGCPSDCRGRRPLRKRSAELGSSGDESVFFFLFFEPAGATGLEPTGVFGVDPVGAIDVEPASARARERV